LIALNFILINYFEFNLYSKNKNENMLVSILFLLTYFSFILNLAREIIKDIQDIKGDYQYGVKSLPITLGIASSYKIVSILCSIATISLIVLIALSSLSIILNIYLYLFCIIPLGYLSLKLWQSTKFNKASNFSKMLKIIMFFGINSLLIIAFIQ
ncbi:MAG: UbiA family prenyltransferase, partial [Lutibacter sp.]